MNKLSGEWGKKQRCQTEYFGCSSVKATAIQSHEKQTTKKKEWNTKTKGFEKKPVAVP